MFFIFNMAAEWYGLWYALNVVNENFLLYLSKKIYFFELVCINLKLSYIRLLLDQNFWLLNKTIKHHRLPKIRLGIKLNRKVILFGHVVIKMFGN